MKKINIIKKSKEFDRIIHHNRSYKYNNFIFYFEATNDDSYHFGLSVGKKIGNAVMRNKVKRQLKSIIDKKVYKNGFNCIIIVLKGIIDQNYKSIEEDYNVAIKKFNIIKGE